MSTPPTRNFTRLAIAIVIAAVILGAAAVASSTLRATVTTVSTADLTTTSTITTLSTVTTSSSSVVIPQGTVYQVQSSYDCVAGHVAQPFNVTATGSALLGAIIAGDPGVGIYVSTSQDAQTVSMGHPASWVYFSGLVNSTTLDVPLGAGSYVLWIEGADMGCGSTVVTPLEQLTNVTVTQAITLGATTKSATSTSGESQGYEVEFEQQARCENSGWVYPWAVTLNGVTVVQPSNETIGESGVPNDEDNGSYSTISFTLPDGTYSYTVLPTTYFSQSGNVTIDGRNVVVQVHQTLLAEGCSTSVSTTVATSSTSSSVNDASLGLRLVLGISVNSTGGLYIFGNDANMLNVPNNVTASSQWRYPQYSEGYVCGNFDDAPIAYAVLEGNYGLNNFTSATPLATYNTSLAYPCPTTAAAPTYYLFSPHSDNTSRSTGSGPLENYGPVYLSESLTGYWTDSSAAFHRFSGVYTVVGEDEWGDILLLHFSVASGLQT